MALKNRKKWIIIGIVLALIVFRLLLPTIVKNQVNKTLENMDGYTGHVADVDINLYRGAYAINNIIIEETSEDKENIPFFEARTMDFSIEWAALFDGSIVGEIVAYQAELNFYKKASGEVETGEKNDWVQTVKDLMPLKINKLEVVNSQINYIDKYSKPNVDIYFNNVQGVVTNLTNATDTVNNLPSHIKVNSTSIGEGKFSLVGDLNALKEIPDFDVNIELEEVDLTSLNEFIQAYAKFDVEQGQFDFYSEVILMDSELTGYIKPLIQNIEVIDWQNEDRSLLGTIYEGIVGLAAEGLENQSKDQLGSKVPISGTLEKTDAGVWPAIFSLLKNAFIRPLQHQVDQSLDAQGGVTLSGKEDKKKKKKKKNDEKGLLDKIF